MRKFGSGDPGQDIHVRVQEGSTSGDAFVLIWIPFSKAETDPLFDPCNSLVSALNCLLKPFQKKSAYSS